MSRGAEVLRSQDTDGAEAVPPARNQGKDGDPFDGLRAGEVDSGHLSVEH